jgi:predicted RNase H-like nuclease (RuvC/YqgF family)
MSTDAQVEQEDADEQSVSRAEIEDMQRELKRLRDGLQKEVGQRLAAADDRIDDLEDELHQVHREVDMLREEVESFAGPMSEKTGREKRLADTRLAMIRAARGNRNNGVNDGKAKKHFHDLREMLSQMGHETGLSKPSIASLIEDIAEQSDGFAETEKPNVGNDGVARECKALQVDLNALPAHEESKGVTTGNGGGRVENTAESVGMTD